jgi:hypothetical protein
MITLKIEHAIVDFETWKQAFERDPIGRQRSGVRRYRICRPSDDPRYVLIDLDFDDRPHAEAFLDQLEVVWNRADLSPGLSRDPSRVPAPSAGIPRARIVEEVEAYSY